MTPVPPSPSQFLPNPPEVVQLSSSPPLREELLLLTAGSIEVPSSSLSRMEELNASGCERMGAHLTPSTPTDPSMRWIDARCAMGQPNTDRADIALTRSPDPAPLLGSEHALRSPTQENPEVLVTDAQNTPAPTSIAAAAGWYLVRRMPDAAHPEVWRREPIAAWALVDGHLVAFGATGELAPLRQAEEGRDGHDWHQHEPSAHGCSCDLPVRTELDPSWCGYCCGLTLNLGSLRVHA
jgi:hypothetical protein